MNKVYENFNNLKDRACDYMKEELCYSCSTIVTYERVWRDIRTYMIKNGLSVYSRDVGEMYLDYYLSDKKKDSLSKSQKTIFKKVRNLSLFVEKSTMELTTRKGQKPPELFGFVGNLVKLYINELESKRLSVKTIQRYSTFLYNFMELCNKNKIKSSSEINLPLILVFINKYDKTYPTTVVQLIGVMRGFTSFLYHSKYISTDISRRIPSVKNTKQPKLPSCYTEKEIHVMVNSIDRSTVIGKRNFAIIMLAVRYGLRASDIARLRRKEIFWVENVIKLRQYKTGKELVLPLVAEVGNAIIDYLRLGKRKTNFEYLFTLMKPPYNKITSRAITLVVRRAFHNSGITIGNRRSGSHVLRHSLASRMLEKSIPIHVTQEVLGHRSSETTKTYLRIDLNSLQICCLQVPEISRTFYEQGGGRFYG